MAGEAILGFLSGAMKKKEKKFKDELRRKADLNALFEEIKQRKESQPYVPETAYNKVTTSKVFKEKKATEDIQQIEKLIPYFKHLDEDLRNTLTEAFKEAFSNKPQNITPKPSNILNAIRQNTNKSQQTGAPLSLKDVLIQKSVR